MLRRCLCRRYTLVKWRSNIKVNMSGLGLKLWSNRKNTFKPIYPWNQNVSPCIKWPRSHFTTAGACSTVLVITKIVLDVFPSIANMRYIFARSCNHKIFAYPYTCKIYKSGVPLCLCLTVGSLGINFLRKAKEKENTFTSRRSSTE